MKLYIHTTNSERIRIGINNKMHETDSKKEKSQALLPFIEKTLKDNGYNLHDISEIEVNTGPGSFTGIRVGVSVAQTLGWVLNISVNGKNLNKNEALEIYY